MCILIFAETFGTPKRVFGHQFRLELLDQGVNKSELVFLDQGANKFEPAFLDQGVNKSELVTKNAQARYKRSANYHCRRNTYFLPRKSGPSLNCSQVAECKITLM